MVLYRNYLQFVNFYYFQNFPRRRRNIFLLSSPCCQLPLFCRWGENPHKPLTIWNLWNQVFATNHFIVQKNRLIICDPPYPRRIFYHFLTIFHTVPLFDFFLSPFFSPNLLYYFKYYRCCYYCWCFIFLAARQEYFCQKKLLIFNYLLTNLQMIFTIVGLLIYQLISIYSHFLYL